MTDKDRITALERELAELKAKVDPPKTTFKEMSDAEWRDQMHQLAEKRMALANPPSMVRDLAVLDEKLCAGIRQDRHAPTSATSMIPSSRQAGEVRSPTATTETNTLRSVGRALAGERRRYRSATSRQHRGWCQDGAALEKPTSGTTSQRDRRTQRPARSLST